MKFEWLFDGTLQSRKHRGGGKGDRKAQAKRQAEKRRLAREAARVAACLPPKGKAGKPTKTWRIEMFERRRLRGKQTPMGVRRFARTTHEALQAAKKAASNALEQETLALARLKDVTAFATQTRDALRAARQEASVASDALKAAEQEAAVAVEQKKEANARYADAVDYADRLYADRVKRVAGRRVPPFLG